MRLRFVGARCAINAMAAIDSLLRLLLAQNAQSLVVVSGHVPSLQKNAQPYPLSMPALDHDIVLSFLEDILTQEQIVTLHQGTPVDSVYSSDAQHAFQVHAHLQGEGLSLKFDILGHARPAPAPKPTPDAAARRVCAVAPSPAIPSHPCPTPALVNQTPHDHAPSPPRDFLALLETADAYRASDIVLSSDDNIRVRASTELLELPDSALSELEILHALDSYLSQADHASLETSGSADVAANVPFDGGIRRYRVNVFRQHRGLAAVLRPIRNDVPTLRGLNLPEDFVDLVRFPHGLVLVTGPTGSGKSTTVVALLEHLNRTEQRHIITLENPIEYEYTSRKCLIHQREVGSHVDGFATGLRSALRENPDVIVVGEMRDLATISAAVTAAETGHLVISTLHSGSVVTAIDRMIDVFPGHQQVQIRYQLAGVLRAVLTQVLVPSTQPKRKVPVLEKMIVTHAVAAKIREDRCHQLATEIQTGRADGMISVELSLASLVKARLIDISVARTHARDSRVLDDLIRSAP